MTRGDQIPETVQSLPITVNLQECYHRTRHGGRYLTVAELSLTIFTSVLSCYHGQSPTNVLCYASLTLLLPDNRRLTIVPFVSPTVVPTSVFADESVKTICAHPTRSVSVSELEGKERPTSPKSPNGTWPYQKKSSMIHSAVRKDSS